MENITIPGMYFDAEKNRWFSLGDTARHVTTDPRQDVRPSRRELYGPGTTRHDKSKKRKCRPGETEPSAWTLPNPIQRSKVGTANPLVKRELASENSTVRTRFDQINASASYLYEERVPASFRDDLSDRGGNLTPAKFAWDSATNGALLSQQNVNEDCFLTSFCFWTPHSRHVPFRRTIPELIVTHNHGLRPPGHISSTITSISISKSRVAAVTTLGGARNSSLVLMQLSDPELHDAHPPEFDVTIVYGQPDGTVWCSSPAPLRSNGATFAVGSDNGILLWQDAQVNWRLSCKIATPGAVHSLDWLSEHVVAGGRNTGEILLWDTRSSAKSAVVQRLRHPTIVDNLRKADHNGHHLLASGPGGATATYDFRMSPRSKGGWQDLVGNRAFPQNRLSKCDTPVVRFPHVAGRCSLDVHLGLNLLAAGSDEGTVKMYTLDTGEFVRATDKLRGPWHWPSEDTDITLPRQVHQVQWVDVLGEDVLMWTAGGSVKAMSWPRDGDDVDDNDNDNLRDVHHLQFGLSDSAETSSDESD